CRRSWLTCLPMRNSRRPSAGHPASRGKGMQKPMFEKVKQFAVVWLAFVPLTCPQARAQLRSDLIESARLEKEANLTPERPPKVERKIVWAENSLGYKLLTGQVEGIGGGFGNIVPGSGFAIGPQYKRTDLWGGRLTLKMESRAA